MKVALLISTYNWPEALDLILKSAIDQVQLPDEIIIADDGSASETRAIIESYKEIFSIPLTHVWHEDQGFRKSIILNKAIAQSSSDYIIQIDGDCIIHPYFVKDHLAMAQDNTYLFGSRVNIKDDYKYTLFEDRITKFEYGAKGLRNKTRNLHSPFLSQWFWRRSSISKKLRGCNVSYWRRDFLDSNGYNEDMTGWGREDSEMIIRLMNKGVKARRIRYRGIVYHIPHKIKSKERLDINDQIQQTAIDEKIIRCSNGVDKYLND